MYSSHSQQRIYHSGSSSSGSRSVITWLMIVLIMLFLLHSSNLLLSPNDKPDCSELAASESHLQITNTTASAALENEDDKTEDEETDQYEEDDEALVAELPSETPEIPPTELKHVVFGIAASSNLWDIRKEYIKTWWRPGETRGVVWLDQKVTTSRNEGLPQIRISADTSTFKYKNPQVFLFASRLR